MIHNLYTYTHTHMQLLSCATAQFFSSPRLLGHQLVMIDICRDDSSLKTDQSSLNPDEAAETHGVIAETPFAYKP